MLVMGSSWKYNWQCNQKQTKERNRKKGFFFLYSSCIIFAISNVCFSVNVLCGIAIVLLISISYCAFSATIM